MLVCVSGFFDGCTFGYFLLLPERKKTNCVIYTLSDSVDTLGDDPCRTAGCFAAA